MIDFKPAVRFLKLDAMGEKCAEMGRNMTANVPLTILNSVTALAVSVVGSKIAIDFIQDFRNGKPVDAMIQAVGELGLGYVVGTVFKQSNQLGKNELKLRDQVRRANAILNAKLKPSL